MQVETLFRAHHFTFEATICCSTLECGEPQLILTMAKVGVLTTTKYQYQLVVRIVKNEICLGAHNNNINEVIGPTPSIF